MKVRLGLISNSSSSSFVLENAGQMERFKAVFGERYIPVAGLIERLGDFQREANELREYLKDHSFILEEVFNECGQMNPGDSSFLIESLKNLSEGSYITEPVDRDVAYQEGLDFEVWEGDL